MESGCDGSSFKIKVKFSVRVYSTCQNALLFLFSHQKRQLSRRFFAAPPSSSPFIHHGFSRASSHAILLCAPTPCVTVVLFTRCFRNKSRFLRDRWFPPWNENMETPQKETAAAPGEAPQELQAHKIKLSENPQQTSMFYFRGGVHSSFICTA